MPVRKNEVLHKIFSKGEEDFIYRLPIQATRGKGFKNNYLANSNYENKNITNLNNF